MHPYDVESHLQLAREHAAGLAADYDRARKAESRPRSAASKGRSPVTATLLRALRLSRRPAYRA